MINTNKKKTVSIVIPVYQAQQTLPTLFRRIHAAMQRITKTYEIICIEDGSMDNSWQVLSKLAQSNRHIIVIRLSRNFGQHNALNAGLRKATGDYIIVMDCDLQDNPADIPLLFSALTPRVACVLTKKIKRKQSSIRKIFGVGFYRLLGWTTHHAIDQNIGGFSLLTKKVLRAYNTVGDINKFYLPTLLWLGYPYTVIPVIHYPRFEGPSSYSFTKLIRHGMNGLIMSSDMLLRLSISIGLLCMMLSFISGGYILTTVLLFHKTFLAGWTSLITVLIFSTGIILFCIGIIGLYVSQILEQVRGRNPYIITQTIHKN